MKKKSMSSNPNFNSSSSYGEYFPCLMCGHKIQLHKINIIGRYDYMEISCGAQTGENYIDVCGCDAGFRKVAIKKEFTILETDKR